jgi:hypothetical protein
MTFLEQFTDATFLIRYLPEIVLWITALIFAAMMLKRGGGRAEKLFLSGCVLMVLYTLLDLFMGAWFAIASNNGSVRQMVILRSLSSIPSLAGLICLTIAFVMKFWVKGGKTA